MSGNKLVVIFNGPPNSGKDAIVDGIMSLVGDTSTGFQMHKMCFKDALYEISYEYMIENMNITSDRANEIIELSKNRETKEVVQEDIKKTPRELLIHVSEGVIKPNKGKDYFGKRFLERVLDIGEEGDEHLILTPDGGFDEEIKILNDAGIPTVVIQLRRSGASFDGDSRKYVQGLVTYSLINQGTLDEAIVASCRLISDAIERIQKIMDDAITDVEIVNDK